MKAIFFVIGAATALPVITKRQIWGNKSGLLCQHDHFHLFDDQCKLDPSESGGGLMSLLSGGGSGGLASLMSMFGMKE